MNTRTSFLSRAGLGALCLSLALATGACASMQEAQGDDAETQTTLAPTETSVNAHVANWPQAAREAATAMMEKYGPPHEVTATHLMWRNNGPWLWTRIDNQASRHLFPVPHNDVMEQAVRYRIPPAMADELTTYDGSVHLFRTQGLISARCDKEGANFLALNLADDVAQGRRTVADARAYYAQAIAAFMQTGQPDPYMQGHRFQPPSAAQAGDPDESATS